MFLTSRVSLGLLLLGIAIFKLPAFANIDTSPLSAQAQRRIRNLEACFADITGFRMPALPPELIVPERCSIARRIEIFGENAGVPGELIPLLYALDAGQSGAVRVYSDARMTRVVDFARPLSHDLRLSGLAALLRYRNLLESDFGRLETAATRTFRNNQVNQGIVESALHALGNLRELCRNFLPLHSNPLARDHSVAALTEYWLTEHYNKGLRDAGSWISAHQTLYFPRRDSSELQALLTGVLSQARACILADPSYRLLTPTQLDQQISALQTLDWLRSIRRENCPESPETVPAPLWLQVDFAQRERLACVLKAGLDETAHVEALYRAEFEKARVAWERALHSREWNEILRARIHGLLQISTEFGSIMDLRSQIISEISEPIYLDLQAQRLVRANLRYLAIELPSGILRLEDEQIWRNNWNHSLIDLKIRVISARELPNGNLSLVLGPHRIMAWRPTPLENLYSVFQRVFSNN